MLTDPIAALATPAGRSAVAVIRVSGDGVFAVAARVIAGFVADPPRTARLATFRDAAGHPLDRGLYLTFRAPASETGEDVVELHTHGGLLVPAQVLAALQAAGARQAMPGEFTRRAVMHGKLDLLQAEAVADLVDATAAAQGRSAIRQMEGGLSRRLVALRERMVEFLALLGYEVDFPEEDDGPLDRRALTALLAEVEQQVAALLATAPLGERLHDGALVVFAGRPNAGKSSLFNALLGTERALVTEVPGTTRDTIEATTQMEGWPVRLADTAGLWEAPDRLDAMGVEVSRRYLEAADLVLLCVEGDRPLGADEEEVLATRPALLVRTKGDLPSVRGAIGPEATPLSAHTGHGLDLLRHAVVARLFGAGEGYADLEPMLTRERHREALTRSAGELTAAGPHLTAGGDAALAAHHVGAAVLALDELIGAVGTEDVLDRIFSRFCVGK